MQGDLPHTLFNHRASGKSPEKNTVASDEVLRLQEEANRQMMERKAAREREKSFNDLNENNKE